MEDTAMFSPPRKADMPNSLFQPHAPAEHKSPSSPAPAQAPSKSLFQFSAPAPAEQPASAPAPAEAPTKPLFQFSAPAPAEQPASAQLPAEGPTKSLFNFSAFAPVDQQTVSSLAPAQASPVQAPTKSLFQFQAPVEHETASSPAPAQAPAPAPAQAPTKSLFGSQAPVEEPTASSTAPAQAALKPLFPFQKPVEPQTVSSTTPVQDPAQPASKEVPDSLFSFQAPIKQPLSLAGPAARAVIKAPVEYEKIKLRSNGPSEPLITDDHSKWTEHDRKYRLRSLNKELLRRLALYDPGSQDFDNVVIFYYQTRERLGLIGPFGARNTKRKADDEDPPADQSSPVKKTKTTELSGSNANPTSSIFSNASGNPFGASTQTSNETSTLSNVGPSSSFTGSSNGTPAPFSSGLSKPYKGPSSNTSNLFQSMLSAASAPTEPSEPKSPFANVPTQPPSAGKSLLSFSQPAAPKVTSPTKPVSPPTSDDVEEEDDAEDQESGEEGSAEAENEDQVLEGQSGSGDDNGSDDDEEDEQAPLSKPENLGKSLFDRIQPPFSNGEPAVKTPNGIQDKNTLKHPAPNHSFQPYTPFAPGFSKSTPQAPTVSPITPFGGSVKSKPATTFEFTPKAPINTPTPIPGASIFAGGSIKTNGPIPGDGLFGSRPSTPNNDELAPKTIFAGLTKVPQTTIDPSKDNTWSKGSPLKFDTSQKITSEGFRFGGAISTNTNFMKAFGKTAEEHEAADKAKRKYEDLGSDAEEDEIEEWEKEYEEKQRVKHTKTTGPSSFGQGGFKPSVAQLDGQADKQTTSPPSLSITAATPLSKGAASSEKFANLFGQKSDTASPAPPATNPVGFSFGAAPIAGSALQPAASYLFPSGNTSGLSSRATSPGMTDTESVGTDGEADGTNDPQTSLMSDRPGEENEEVLYEARTKALKFMDKTTAAKQKGTTPDAYNSVGLGILRVLRNAETGKARIVIRAEPGANVLLNTHLVSFINYTNDSRAAGSGVVRFGVPVENGKIEQWVLKVKSSEKAAALAAVLTNNKSST